MTSSALKHFSLAVVLSLTWLGAAYAGWDDGGSGDGGQTCVVTSTSDDVLDLNSLRRKVESGYNLNNGFCVTKIVLQNDVNLTAPLAIDNAADGDGVIIEGEGGMRTISVDGDCGLRLKSDRITLRNVRIRGSNGAAICVESGFNRIEDAVVEGNQTGILLEGGANVVTDSVFRNNSGDAVSLVNGHNEITRNSFYGNGGLAVDSPNADIQPNLNSVFRTSDTEFTAYVSVPSDVQRVELYRTYPAEGGTDTYIASTTEFLSRTATLTFAGKNGDSVYALAFLNGSTSAVSDAVTLSDTGGGNNGGGNGSPLSCASGPIAPGTVIQRTCAPGFGSPPLQDSDCDGIKDNQEDKNKNCLWNPEDGETDAVNSDSDGDGLNDGKEDRNKDGVYDAATETNALEGDTDGLPNVLEDVNGNCTRDGAETDAYDPDTDGDGITDGIEKLGGSDPNRVDTDKDGLDDGEEDVNKDGVAQPWETDAKKPDTDGDGQDDVLDACPLISDETCTKECHVGELPHELKDSDRDGLPDRLEDANHDCVRQFGETDAFVADTDDDGLADGVEDYNRNGVVDAGETDPRNPDTDRDGIVDGKEDRNGNRLVDFMECSPLSTDSDGDGLPDALEDRNLNGIVDAGETSCALDDSDGDGIADGAEDSNRNGRVDYLECDPAVVDTDGDGISDTLEDANLDGVFDDVETSCYLTDSDFDGLSDGTEDTNHNGIVEPGESDPAVPDSDGDGAQDGVDPRPIFSSSGDLKKAEGRGGCSLVR